MGFSLQPYKPAAATAGSNVLGVKFMAARSGAAAGTGLAALDPTAIDLTGENKMRNGQKSMQMGLVAGAKGRQAALRAIAKIDAAVCRDRQSAQRECWLGEVDAQLREGIAIVASLLSEPGLSVNSRHLGPRIGRALARISEQRQRIAISRALHAVRVGGMWPKRVEASQTVRFRDSDEKMIDRARAAARNDSNPNRTESG